MHDFKVVTAETADDAIDAIHLHRPVAAIVDLRLARGSGRDVVVSMPAGTPVIIFSGVPSESAELERLRPRTRLVQKPYSLTMLVEALKEMIGTHGPPEGGRYRKAWAGAIMWKDFYAPPQRRSDATILFLRKRELSAPATRR